MPSVTVAGGRFQLIGTDAQNAILLPIFAHGNPSFIAFPWALMDDLPRYPVPISWEDLNDGTLRATPEHSVSSGVVYKKAALHPHFHDDEGEGHAISRPGTDGRLAIAGVFWTDGRIKIDIRMEANPEAAREVCSAELAHAVDYGLPMTGEMKQSIMRLLHPGGEDGHSWWEKSDYGVEYYTLGGEAFMALFTHAYSKMEPWQDPFTHKSTEQIAADVPAILGAPVVGTDPPIGLTARGWRTSFGNGRAELRWEGARGISVTVYRNGSRLMTTANDGVFTNNLRSLRGTFSYQIADAEGRKSNMVSVVI